MKQEDYKKTIRDCRNCSFAVIGEADPLIVYCLMKGKVFNLEEEDPSKDCPYFKYGGDEE